MLNIWTHTYMRNQICGNWHSNNYIPLGEHTCCAFVQKSLTYCPSNHMCLSHVFCSGVEQSPGCVVTFSCARIRYCCVFGEEMITVSRDDVSWYTIIYIYIYIYIFVFMSVTHMCGKLLTLSCLKPSRGSGDCLVNQAQSVLIACQWSLPLLEAHP